MKTRYFVYDTEQEDIELMEVNKDTFDRAEGETTSERRTTFENGVNQTCHFKHNY